MLALLPATARTQVDAVNVAYHHGQLPRAPDAITSLGLDVFGDRINLYDGSFSFEQTDVSLPGNNALPVAVSRKWTARAWIVRGAMGDWDLETPRIQGTFADPEGFVPWGGSPANRCSGFNASPGVARGTGIDLHSFAVSPGTAAPPAPRSGARGNPGQAMHMIAGSVRDFSEWEYWGGTYVSIPGHGSQEILRRARGNTLAPADGGSYPLVTAQNWQIGCLAALRNAPGQGFVALAPDGTRYRFDWHATRLQTMMRKGDAALGRQDHFLMATEVVDRFGNWVRYTYDAANPLNLTRIEASDGRVITLGYAGGRVSWVHDGTRTWQYTYLANGDLGAIVLPDQSRWSFTMRPMVYPQNFVDEGTALCDGIPMAPGGIYVGTMTHPSGAVGRFSSQFVVNSRTNVQRACPTLPGSTAEDSPIWPRYILTQAMVRKEITGPGLPPMVWQYGVGGGGDAWAPCSTCPDRKTSIVVEPDGSVTRHVFGIRWRENEGLLLRLEEADRHGNLLRATDYRYRPSTGQNYPDRWGDSVLFTSDVLSSRNLPKDLRQIWQQDVRFRWEAADSAAGFDRFARPALVVHASDLGDTRTLLTQYDNHLGRWVLGQVSQVTETGTGRVPQATEYDPVTALPVRQLSFGRPVHTLQYRADGTLMRRDEGAGRVTVFNDFMRGEPQQAVFADMTSARRVVDNIGAVRSITNEVKTTHRLGVDAMGRLPRIDYPAGDASSYFPTQLRFEPNPMAERGLPPGHWRQIITTGNAVTVRWFDALWRVRLEGRYDAANPGATSRFVETRYDGRGRKVFQSYPQRNITSVDLPATPGVAYVYDALGRVTEESASTELGVPAVTTSKYLSGFSKQVIDPRGHATTLRFQAFDTPVEDAPVEARMPENVLLSIQRDVFGKALRITRSGPWAAGWSALTRSYVYDIHERLCKTVEPETGATVQDYDAANNIAWRASGQALPNPNSCDWTSVPLASRVVFSYDLRNRLKDTTYGDGSAGPAITRSYTADGLLGSVSSMGSTWTYSYNNRRLLALEQATRLGEVFNFGRDVDAYGHTARQRYPDGSSVSYQPDALGQPTEVRLWPNAAGHPRSAQGLTLQGFASSVSHHPNGMVAGYTLGNGIVHSSTQTVRGLPQLWRDSGVLHDLYAWDRKGNVERITDQQEGLTSRTMQYDGLDRLVGATGIWGSAGYVYDALDNLRSTVVGGRTTVASFNSRNLLDGLSANGVSQPFEYDANGNLTRRGAQQFSFDLANRLMLATGKASYAYDGHGRRTWVGYSSGGGKLQLYSVDGRLLWSRHSGEGTTQHVYLGKRLIAEVTTQGTAAAVSYAHTDALGSPVARSNAAGQVTSRTRYEPYGATAAGTNPTGIGFTGHVNDPDTGLVYMQQRYYDPLAGRFLSVDPVTTNAKDGSFFNRYVYGNNNPYKYKDPDGRAFETAWDVASLALSVGQFMQSPSLGNALGVVVDAAAVALPGIPGGVGALRAMGNAAEAGGRAAKTEVHHVVPQADKRAAEARDVMKSHGINPKTEPTNKVPLPGDKHDITKRDSYVRDTNQRVAAQPNADAVKAECCKIADNLQKSTVDELNKQYPAK